MTSPSAPAYPQPFPTPPRPGEVLEVADGIFWVRMPLPFRLDHVNVYLIRDGDGFAAIDVGIDGEVTRGLWDGLLAGFLAGRPLTRLVITHFHPDHVGAAGWLAGRCGLTVEMSEAEFLSALVLSLDPGFLEAEPYRRFYLDNGLAPEITNGVVTSGHAYMRMVSRLPPTFRRIIAGEKLRIGGRDFEVLTGGGHSPEQVMLYAPADNIFLAADQVLTRISPNVSVLARDPEGDPLGIFLRSLRSVKGAVPADALVLPGHDLPFTGLHERADALMEHHWTRCREIETACRDHPLSAAEIVGRVFHRPLDPHQTGFAFTEIVAHLNYMLRRGQLRRADSQDGIRRVVS